MVRVVWFKRDLRTTDHRPLAEAAASGPIIPLYVVEPAYWALPDASRRQWTAVSSALRELSARLTALGAPLIVRPGTVTACLQRIHAAVGMTALLAHEETGNAWTYARDLDVHQFCRAAGIPFIEYPQFGVIRRLRNRDDWGRLHAAFLDAPIIAEPARLVPAAAVPPGRIPDADDLGLPDDGCARPQPGDRASALRLLDSFFAGRGADYRRAMSGPSAGARACSRLSVPLATGAVSIREVMNRATRERAIIGEVPSHARPVPLTAIDSLVSRLHWHCHFIQKLESEPALEYRSLHSAHEAGRVPTAADDPLLDAWATGRTGFPFLDACMRSLIATGWLNFRMRAMVTAFATYQLGLDWHAAGTRLARLFTDYEPGIHWPQVQMQAGQTGINTPRMYNPVKQGIDQDPDGTFTRRWVPELARVPLVELHDGQAGLIDLAAAARQARDRLSHIRQTPGYRAAAEAVYARHGSRARRIDDDNIPRRRPAPVRQLGLDL